MNSFAKKWEYFAAHIWLLTSSYGIMFAILSFLQDLGCFSEIERYSWFKGVISIVLGILYYFIIGIPHVRGTKLLDNQPIRKTSTLDNVDVESENYLKLEERGYCGKTYYMEEKSNKIYDLSGVIIGTWKTGTGPKLLFSTNV